MTDEPVRYIMTGRATFTVTPPSYDVVVPADVSKSYGDTQAFPEPTGESLYVPVVELSDLLGWMDDAMEELTDVRAQWGDDHLWRKHNEHYYQELLGRLEWLKNHTQSGEL